MIVDVVYGFLGAGKTTFIRYLLEHPPESQKLVILVNEFGEVGLDGLLLEQQGASVADVVEMPSGCICCTMSADFRRQIHELHERYHPDRMLVEPTGVATISQILNILEREDVAPLCSEVRRVHILDATEFLSLIKSHRHFMENQLRGGNVILLNKTDRISPSRVPLLVSSIQEINPEARVFPTSFARLDPETLEEIFGSPVPAAVASHGEEHPPDMPGEPPRHGHKEEHHEHDHAHEHDHDEEEHGLAAHYDSFGRAFPGETFHPDRVEDFFARLRDGKFGEVVRAKGVFRTPEGWIKVELASGEVRVDPWPAAPESVVSIIGRFMNTPEMEARLRACCSG